MPRSAHCLQLVVSCGLLVGCAASQQDLRSVATAESARMQPPSQRLSTFSSFELEPMTRSSEVTTDQKKNAESIKLEQKLRAKIQPLLDSWNAEAREGGPGLTIRPELVSLYIPSGNARFWAGAFMGNAEIDLSLELVEKQSEAVVAYARVQKQADAMAGAWSVGQSDQNLHDYVAEIAYEYLKSNY